MFVWPVVRICPEVNLEAVANLSTVISYFPGTALVPALTASFVSSELVVFFEKKLFGFIKASIFVLRLVNRVWMSDQAVFSLVNVSFWLLYWVSLPDCAAIRESIVSEVIPESVSYTHLTLPTKRIV